MRGSIRSRSTTSTTAIVIFILFMTTVVPVHPAQSLPTTNMPSRGNYPLSRVSLTSPVPSYLDYHTSNIDVLILYDLSTGAQVYAYGWESFLAGCGYHVCLLSLQQAIDNTILMHDYDLILVDHSCGGNGGKEANSDEAKMIAGSGSPLLLLGGAHGIIDRIADYEDVMGQVAVTGMIQKAHDKIDHSIYTSPYFVTEAGFGPPNSIEILTQTMDLESYPLNVIKGLCAMGLIEGATKPTVGAIYSSQGIGGRIFWWAFQDPSKLNINGQQLLINTIEWLGGFTDLDLTLSFLKELESTYTYRSTYWTGGFADHFEPQVPATYYACESLRFIGRLNTINVSDLVDWLTTHCYSSTEGFFRSPYRYLSSSWSGVVETGMAMQILSELGALTRVNLTRISAYVDSCQLADGFVRYPGDALKSLTNTYWALMTLNVTGGLNGINRTGAIDYILSCQNLNQFDIANFGGFADYPGGVSHAESTFKALSSLGMIGGMDSVSRAIVVQWLMNGYVGSAGLFFEEQVFRQRYTVNYGTGYSAASLSILGNLQNIDQECVASYLSSVQFGDGGWSGANCTDEPIDEIFDCYPVLLGLKELGRVNVIRDLDGFVGFVTRCLSPSPTYGFSNLPNTLSNTWQTYNAIMILYDLGVIDSLRTARVYNFIVSSYRYAPARFELYKVDYPTSSDGYNFGTIELPFEYSFLQRARRGVILSDLAIESLLRLGCQDWVNASAQRLWNEVSQCEATTGPFSGFYAAVSDVIASNLTAGLRYTYHALNCLLNLGSFLNYTEEFPDHLLNSTMTIERIMSLYEAPAGYFRDDSYVLEPYSPVESTFMALSSLQMLNALSNVDYTKTVEFLQSHLYSSLVDSYYSFKGLQILGRLSVVDPTKLVEYVESCRKPNGVFKSDDTALYRLDTTAMAIEVLTHYNHTWITAKQTRVIIGSLNAPSAMELGQRYVANLSLVDSQFMLPLTGATVSIRLGAYQFEAVEQGKNSGRYSANITVPISGELLGAQCLTFRCCKGRYQTEVIQTSTDISSTKTLTEVTIIRPFDNYCQTTSNMSVAALVYALDGSGTPIVGVELHLYVNDSLVETELSDSSGRAAFNWAANSSGDYFLRIVFEGSNELYWGEASKVVSVDKTPTLLSIRASHTGSEPIEVGSILQLTSQLSEWLGGKPLANTNITFSVSTPSGTRLDIPAVTTSDGVASAQLTISENGTYLIHSEFASTDYYTGSVSSVLSIEVVFDSNPNGGESGGDSGDSRNPWFSALLNALTVPLGCGLLIASGSLAAIAFLLRAKQKELESIDNITIQRRVSKGLQTDVRKRSDKRGES